MRNHIARRGFLPDVTVDWQRVANAEPSLAGMQSALSVLDYDLGQAFAAMSLTEREAVIRRLMLRQGYDAANETPSTAAQITALASEDAEPVTLAHRAQKLAQTAGAA
jgi:hypothetical protein